MNKYTFYVTYQDRRALIDEERVLKIEVENEEIKTEKLAFQCAIMKAFDKRYQYEGIYKIELAEVE